MLYNPNLKFKSRAYLDFNCAIKLIKLRSSLSSLVGNPDIFLREKTSEDMYETILKFAEMRKLDRAALVRDMDLFPEVSKLQVFERKYGDAITFEDINGFRKKKKRVRKVTDIELRDSKSMSHKQSAG